MKDRLVSSCVKFRLDSTVRIANWEPSFCFWNGRGTEWEGMFQQYAEEVLKEGLLKICSEINGAIGVYPEFWRRFKNRNTSAM